MTVYVTAVSPSSANGHERISAVRWLDSANSVSKTMSVAQAVNWIKTGHELWVAGDTGKISVQVVEATPPYLRTVADGKYTNNLLSLPRY